MPNLSQTFYFFFWGAFFNAFGLYVFPTMYPPMGVAFAVFALGSIVKDVSEHSDFNLGKAIWQVIARTVPPVIATAVVWKLING